MLRWTEDTYRAIGYGEGWVEGFLAASLPSDRGAYAARRYRERLNQLNDNERPVPASPFWPKEMPGGWPDPPTQPDPDGLWPEKDGWPVPPPNLRGDA